MKYLMFILLVVTALGCCQGTSDEYPTYNLKRVGAISSNGSTYFYSQLYEVEIEGTTYYATAQKGGYFALTPKIQSNDK